MAKKKRNKKNYTASTKSENKERKQKRHEKFLTVLIEGKYRRLKNRLKTFGYTDTDNKSIKQLRLALHPFIVDKKKKEKYKHWRTEMYNKLKGLIN